MANKITDPSMKVSATERAAGKRAAFHVYYRRNGTMYFDPSWLETSEEAGQSVVKMVKQCYPRSTVELVKTVKLEPVAL